jgi:hypothetical protein
MKYIKIYESFIQANPSALNNLKSTIESGIESEVKPPIYLDSSQETPVLVKFLSELIGDKLMDMMIINLDQLSLQELRDSFPKEVPMDKGGIIFIDGIGQARPENKKMLFDKILDGSIPPVWQIIVNGPSKQEDKDSLESFTVVKIN